MLSVDAQASTEQETILYASRMVPIERETNSIGNKREAYSISSSYIISKYKNKICHHSN